MHIIIALIFTATPDFQVFFDTDRNVSTGYGPKGHEYVLRDGVLYQTLGGGALGATKNSPVG